MTLPFDGPCVFFTLPARRGEYDDETKSQNASPGGRVICKSSTTLPLPKTYDTTLVRATEFAEMARRKNAPQHNSQARRLRRAEQEHIYAIYGDRQLTLRQLADVARNSPIEPEWLGNLVHAASDTNEETRFLHTTVLVDSLQDAISLYGENDTTHLAIAQHLVWHATWWLSPMLCMRAAKFARFFGLVLDDPKMSPHLRAIAPNYLEAIRLCTMVTFEKWWRSDEPHSITDDQWEPYSHVPEALASAIFIGELYKMDIVSAADVRVCLDILLLDNIPALEHIHAAHLLIHHSGVDFVRSQNTAQYLSVWTENLSFYGRRVKARKTMLGQEYTTAEVNAWVNEITKLVNLWVPSLLVFQDEFESSSPDGLFED